VLQPSIGGVPLNPAQCARQVSSTRARKRPWRYRWPDEVRDEVLVRLLKLNAERAEEEKLAGVAAAAPARTKPTKSRGKKSDAAAAQGDLIAPPQKDLFG
jgi:hypothetical protein